jgi:hypothetical protein
MTKSRGRMPFFGARAPKTSLTLWGRSPKMSLTLWGRGPQDEPDPFGAGAPKDKPGEGPRKDTRHVKGSARHCGQTLRA